MCWRQRMPPERRETGHRTLPQRPRLHKVLHCLGSGLPLDPEWTLRRARKRMALTWLHLTSHRSSTCPSTTVAGRRGWANAQVVQTTGAWLDRHRTRRSGERGRTVPGVPERDIQNATNGGKSRKAVNNISMFIIRADRSILWRKSWQSPR